MGSAPRGVPGRWAGDVWRELRRALAVALITRGCAGAGAPDPLARGNVPSRAPRRHGTRRGNTCHQQRHFQGCEAHLELTCEFLEDGPWFNPTCVLRPASDLSRMDEQTNRVFIEHFISTEMGLRLRTPWKPCSSLPSSSLRLQRLLHSELEGNKAGVPVLWSECFMPQIRVLKSQPPVMASGGGPFRRS